MDKNPSLLPIELHTSNHPWPWTWIIVDGLDELIAEAALNIEGEIDCAAVYNAVLAGEVVICEHYAARRHEPGERAGDNPRLWSV